MGLQRPTRPRWPEATGICYYKLTDVYPACAWATGDWYGVPKIAYYLSAQAYQPLHACAVFDHLAVPEGEGLTAPIFLLDDADQLVSGWRVLSRVFDASLKEVARAEFTGAGGIERVRRLGELVVPPERARSHPLLVVTEVRSGSRLRDRTFYWLNYAANPGCLFALPQTRLRVRAEANRFIIENRGSVPAVGVHFDCPEISDRFVAEDAYFWLDPGERRSVRVSATTGVTIGAWNAPPAAGTDGACPLERFRVESQNVGLEEFSPAPAPPLPACAGFRGMP